MRPSRRPTLARFARLFASLVLFCPLGVAMAEEAPPDWVPPAESQFDWIQLTSGEWVKGEMRGLRDRKVDFDSDKLDDLSIDWSDVRTMYLRLPHTFRLSTDENLQGIGVLRDEVLTVTGDDGVKSAPRDQIISIIAGDGSEWDYWSAYMGVDYSYRTGNTDQVDLSGNAGFKREDPHTRWKSDYRGIYSELDGDKNTENHRASTRLDVFLTSRFFLTTPFVDYYRDQFQNIDHRVTPGMAVGYEFMRNSWGELDTSIGGAYQYTSFEEVEDGEDDDAHDAAIVTNITFDLDLPRGVELDNLYRNNLVVTDLNKTSHHFESILSFDVWGPLELNSTFMIDRIEKPEKVPRGANALDPSPRRPSRNDIRIMMGLSVDL